MVTAEWTIDVPTGVELTGFEYTVIFTGDEEALLGLLEADVRILKFEASREVVTVDLTATYTYSGEATARSTAAATASCGPAPPAYLPDAQLRPG